MESSSNLILVDWLTWVSRIDSVDGIKELLGLDHQTWEECEHGRYGYPKRIKFGHINILYGSSDDMGVCCEMSGQGCREYESFSIFTWQRLLDCITGEDPKDCHVTRLDLAFDDHTGILDMPQLLDDTDDHNYTKRGDWWKVEYGSEGSTIYHGSPTSKIRLRIYDKAAERGCQEGEHWIRVELQLRDDNAHGAASRVSSSDVGSIFRGMLRNFITYRVPTSDSNRSRWPVASYWEELLEGADAIHVLESPGVDYNVFRLTKYLTHQAGASILCYRHILGLDDLMEQIVHTGCRISPKYQHLVAEYDLLKSYGGYPGQISFFDDGGVIDEETD